MNKKIVALYLIALTITSYATDVTQFEATCLDIGFKKKTEALSDCMLELMLRTKRKDIELQAAQQKAYEQEQQYQRANQARAIDIKNRELERQQAAEMQRRQEVALQQQQEQNGFAALLNILNAGLQGYNQGMRQSMPIQNHRIINCQTKALPLTNSVDTTCTQ